MVADRADVVKFLDKQARDSPKPSKFLADSFMGVAPLSENLLSTVSGRTNKVTVFFAQFLAPNRHQNDAQTQ